MLRFYQNNSPDQPPSANAMSDEVVHPDQFQINNTTGHIAFHLATNEQKERQLPPVSPTVPIIYYEFCHKMNQRFLMLIKISFPILFMAAAKCIFRLTEKTEPFGKTPHLLLPWAQMIGQIKSHYEIKPCFSNGYKDFTNEFWNPENNIFNWIKRVENLLFSKVYIGLQKANFVGPAFRNILQKDEW